MFRASTREPVVAFGTATNKRQPVPHAFWPPKGGEFPTPTHPVENSASAAFSVPVRIMKSSDVDVRLAGAGLAAAGFHLPIVDFRSPILIRSQFANRKSAIVTFRARPLEIP